MNLVIRADATTKIGIGHVMRCIALSQAWKSRGGAAFFVSRCESDVLKQRIKDEGFAFLSPGYPASDPMHIIEMVSGGRFGSSDQLWLVVDGYHFSHNYQKAIRKAGIRLLVIDDIAHLETYHADLLLNQNIGAEEFVYRTDGDTRQLLGNRFALIRREFLIQKPRKASPRKIRNVLVTLGGGDPENVTALVLNALNWLSDAHLAVKIVVGPTNPNIAAIEEKAGKAQFSSQLVTTVEKMPELMLWADVAITAGGSTCWELAYFGIPALIIAIAENQRGISEGLAAAGAAIYCGWFKDLKMEQLAGDIKRLIHDPDGYVQLSNKAMDFIDGLGSDRVVDNMIELQKLKNENTLIGQ